MENKCRFLLFSALCLIAIALDSCSSDYTNKETNVQAIVTVSYNSGSVTLVDASGNTYIPTSTSFVSNGNTYSITSANDGHLAFIVYDLKTNSSSQSSSYNVTLSYFKDINTYYHNQMIYTTKGAVDDSVSNIKSANDSLVSVDGVSIMGGNLNNIQLLALLDYCPGVSSYNTLVCYTDQGLVPAKSSNYDTLNVWLCHHAIGQMYQNTTYDWSKTYPYLYYFGFNLEKAIYLAAGETSKDSVVIDLKARIASSSTSVAWKGYCCKARVH